MHLFQPNTGQQHFELLCFLSIVFHLQLLSISLLVSLYSSPPLVLTSYGFLAVLATLYCPFLVDPSWTINQFTVFLLVTQPTTRDIVILNHTLVVSLSTGMLNSMSCTFLSKLLQFQSQLILDYFSYKLFLSLLKIMLYPSHRSICNQCSFCYRTCTISIFRVSACSPKSPAVSLALFPNRVINFHFTITCSSHGYTCSNRQP
jgi:hypothetical protein